jgi:putative DNA primase/helicase
LIATLLTRQKNASAFPRCGGCSVSSANLKRQGRVRFGETDIQVFQFSQVVAWPKISRPPKLSTVRRFSGNNIPGVAIHFFGDSTSGKSTAQYLAASSWGSPKFLLSWSGTVNGLESQAASRSSTITLLDESHLIEPKQLDAGIYMLLNGVAKSRMSRDATAKAIARWLAAIFSSGERSTQTHLTTKFTDHKAGQGVRMVDVPVIALHGLFDNLHGWPSAKEFAEHLKNAAAEDYGYAGPQLVEYLINNRATLDLKRRLATTTMAMTAGTKLSAQESRVLRSFALIALAGELAIESGLLPWASGSVQAASRALFDIWKEAQPQSGTSREHAQILEKVSDFIQRHRDTRFTDIKTRTYIDTDGRGNQTVKKCEDQPRAYDRAGYWEDISSLRAYLFTKDGLREATLGFDFGRVLRALEEAEAFSDKGYGNEKAKKRWLPDGGQAKLYHINPEKLESAPPP